MKEVIGNIYCILLLIVEAGFLIVMTRAGVTGIFDLVILVLMAKNIFLLYSSYKDRKKKEENDWNNQEFPKETSPEQTISEQSIPEQTITGNDETLWFCAKCGTPNVFSDRYCKKCGNDRTEQMTGQN